LQTMSFAKLVFVAVWWMPMGSAAVQSDGNGTCSSLPTDTAPAVERVMLQAKQSRPAAVYLQTVASTPFFPSIGKGRCTGVDGQHASVANLWDLTAQQGAVPARTLAKQNVMLFRTVQLSIGIMMLETLIVGSTHRWTNLM